MEKHLQDLSTRLGYQIPIPETQFQKFVTQLIAERDLDYAFFLLGKYKEAFPHSTSLLRYYGDAHLLKGEIEKAREHYTKLLELAPEQSDIRQLLESLK